MKNRNAPGIIGNQNGSAMVFTLLILVIVTVMGISASTTSRIEVKIAANDYLHKRAFYEADGATEAGTEMLEQNISCPKGFDEHPVGSGTYVFRNDFTTSDGAWKNKAVISNLKFWENTVADISSYPSDSHRDLYVYFWEPDSDTDSEPETDDPHTNIVMGGDTVWAKGGAIQMAAGYESKGKGAPGGGAHILYDVYSQRVGETNSRSLVRLEWRHIIGQEGECKY